MATSCVTSGLPKVRALHEGGEESGGRGASVFSEFSEHDGGDKMTARCVCGGAEIDVKLCTCRRLETERFSIGDLDDDACERGGQKVEDECVMLQDVTGSGGGDRAWGGFRVPGGVSTLQSIFLEGNRTDRRSSTRLSAQRVLWRLMSGPWRTTARRSGWRSSCMSLGNARHGSTRTTSAAAGRLRSAVEQLSRVELQLEDLAKENHGEDGFVGQPRRLAAVGADGLDEMPLHTKTVPNDQVKKELERWIPSMVSEYSSLTTENQAVEPFSEKELEEWR